MVNEAKEYVGSGDGRSNVPPSSLPGYPAGQAERFRSSGDWPAEHIVGLMGRHTALSPDRPAVKDGSCVISYRELSGLVVAAEKRLRAEGVVANDVVAVQMPNSAHLVVAALAIWSIGAVFHPLNPRYRLHDVVSILSLSKPRAYLHPRVFGDTDFDSFASQVAKDTNIDFADISIDIDQPVVAWSGLPVHEPVLSIPDPDVPFLLGATSGSTGTPKLYLHHQATQTGEAVHLNRILGLGQNDVLLAIAPLTHRGALMFGLTTALVAGACLVIEREYRPTRTLELIRRHGVTAFMSIPTQIVDLLSCADNGEEVGDGPRILMISGAAVYPELLDNLSRIWPNCLPVTGYGTSETGYSFFTRPGDAPDKLQTCGRLIPGMEAKIDAAAGTAGEILLRGAFVCSGYLNPEHTSQAFRDGWFRTGDIGLVGTDGYLTVTGRLKNIVVRGGLKIQAEEVEGLLADLHGIRRSAIVPLPHYRLGEIAVAFLETPPGVTVDLADVQEHMRRLDVAKFKWPEVVHRVDALPLNAVGKVDRKALRRMALELNSGKV